MTWCHLERLHAPKYDDEPGSVIEVDFYHCNQLLGLTDEAIVEKVKRDLDKMVPGFGDAAVLDAAVVRLPNAVNWYYPGSYRSMPETKSRSFTNAYFAGDIVKTRHGSWSQEKAYVTGLRRRRTPPPPRRGARRPPARRRRAARRGGGACGGRAPREPASTSYDDNRSLLRRAHRGPPTHGPVGWRRRSGRGGGVQGVRESVGGSAAAVSSAGGLHCFTRRRRRARLAERGRGMRGGAGGEAGGVGGVPRLHHRAELVP